MDVNSIIQNQISKAVADKIEQVLPEAIESIVGEINKPEYNSWGRFLSPKQACQYLGVKSIGGLKSLLSDKGIAAIKSGSKTTLYDREQLDKISTASAIEKYLDNIKH